MTAELVELRNQVARLTEEIIRGAAERQKLVARIGTLKEATGLATYQPDVEADLRARVINLCKALGLEAQFGHRLLALLLTESIRAQGGPRPQAPMGIFMRVRDLQRAGHRLYRLDVGEPDFGPPLQVRRAISRFVQRGSAHYTEPGGRPDLRQALVAHLNARYDLQLSAEQVMITSGARMAAFLAIMTLLQPGDEAVVVEPNWPAFHDLVGHAGARSRPLATRFEHEWSLTGDDLEEVLTPTTRLVIWSNPNNPSGKILSPAELDPLVALATKRNVQLLSDETYADFVFTEYRSLLAYQGGHVVVSSFSKSFGMTGHRIGYLAGPPDLIRRAIQLQGLVLTSVSELSQEAALAALRCYEVVPTYARRIKRRVHAARSALRSLPVQLFPPQGGFYLFPRIPRPGFDGNGFVNELLDKFHTALVPGAAFGPYGSHVRIAVCRPVSELRAGIERLREALG